MVVVCVCVVCVHGDLDVEVGVLAGVEEQRNERLASLAPGRRKMDHIIIAGLVRVRVWIECGAGCTIVTAWTHLD